MRSRPSSPASPLGSDGQTRTARHHRTCGGAEVLLTDLRGDVRRDVAEDLADRARWRRGHDGAAVTVRTPNARVEWHRTEERQLVTGGEVAPATGTEDVGALIAVRADE